MLTRSPYLRRSGVRQPRFNLRLPQLALGHIATSDGFGFRNRRGPENGVSATTGLGGIPRSRAILARAIPKSEVRPEVASMATRVEQTKVDRAGARRSGDIRRPGQHRPDRPKPRIIRSWFAKLRRARETAFSLACARESGAVRLPNLGALNFLLPQALDGGGPWRLKAILRAEYSTALYVWKSSRLKYSRPVCSSHTLNRPTSATRLPAR